MTSREQFEAWWVKGNDGLQPRSTWEELRTDDGYNDEFIDMQYEGFKAAEAIYQQKLSESRREFRAADATIHNLELQLADAEARGVDKFATEIGTVYKQLRPGSNNAHALKSVVFRAVEFAAQLRQGASQ